MAGPYANVEDYLDTQFRLLREDFVAPLRSAVKKYREVIGLTRETGDSDELQSVPDVQLFSDVRIADETFALVS